MNKRVLLLGNAKSLWLKEYIRNVHYYFGNKVYFLTYNSVSEEEKMYYERYNTSLFELSRVDGSNSNIVKMLRMIKVFSKLKGRVDILDIQSPPHSVQAYLLGILIRYIRVKTIVSFWGSDIMRINNSDAKKLEHVVRVSDKLVLGTCALREEFRRFFGNKYDLKIRKAIFGSPAIEQIREKKIYDASYYKKILGFDCNKLTVAIGHNGNKSQQHVDVLDALSNLSGRTKAKIHLVLHFGYGGDKEYIDEVLRRCRQLGISFTFIDEYFNLEEIASLRLATDILIHAQTTDALSGSIREALFAETVIINPSWIKYEEFDSMNINYLKYDDTSEIASIIDTFVDEGCNIDLAKNAELVDDNYSWKATLKDWMEIMND